MKKSQIPESIWFGKKEEADLFAEAIEITSKETYIANESIHRNGDTGFNIEDTHASFLINIGRNYQTLYKQSQKKTADTALLPVLAAVMFSEALPSNPLPFLTGLIDGVKINGTDWIRSDEAKMILFTVFQQMYGQAVLFDSFDEFQRLQKVQRDGKK